MHHARDSIAAAVAFAAMFGLGCNSNRNSSTDSAAGTAATPATPATGTAATGASANSSTPSTTGAPATTAPSSTSADTSRTSSAALSDANILAKVDAGDSAEVAVARYMAANTKNPRVKAYADLLERDHAKGISTVEGTAKKVGLTLQLPAGDTTSQEAAHTVDHLKSLSGASRDSAFINHEIADHQQDIADAKQMETAAKQPEVKSLLEKELPELKKHLDRAEALSHQSGETAKK